VSHLRFGSAHHRNENALRNGRRVEFNRLRGATGLARTGIVAGDRLPTQWY
jgi:hypothetical protein